MRAAWGWAGSGNFPSFNCLVVFEAGRGCACFSPGGVVVRCQVHSSFRFSFPQNRGARKLKVRSGYAETPVLHHVPGSLVSWE